MCDGNCEGNRGSGSNDRESESGGENVANGGVISLEELLESLTKSRRRLVLYYLRETEIADVEELATQITAWEADIPPDDVSAETREDIMRRLVHHHLPKLADARIIEYDRRSNVARYADPPMVLDRVLQLLSKLEGKSSS